MKTVTTQEVAQVTVTAPTFASLFVFEPYLIACCAAIFGMLLLKDALQPKRAVMLVVGAGGLGGTLSQLLAKPFLLWLAAHYAYWKPWTQSAESLLVATCILSIFIALFAQALLVRGNKFINPSWERNHD